MVMYLFGWLTLPPFVPAMVFVSGGVLGFSAFSEQSLNLSKPCLDRVQLEASALLQSRHPLEA